MSYDIYGNNLRGGHCEVHPHVHEEYPCSLCDMEYRKHEEKKENEREYWDAMAKEERDHYALLEIAHDIGVCLT